jgi:uncharacterized protein (TIGR03437 family)
VWINALATINNGFTPQRWISLWPCDAAGVAFVISALFMILAAPASGQSLPAFQWMQELDGSGLAYQFAGLGTDAQGNVYVSGSTKSPTFPVKAALQDHLASAGSYDVFITKLDLAGNIVYSTYFGGSANDICRAMTVDAAGNVYVTGSTASQDFPTTRESWAPSMPPPLASNLADSSAYEGAIFVLRLNPDGSLGYSTYFTSNSTPAVAESIAVDSSGAVYFTGVTFGGIPATPGAYRTVCGCASLPGLGFTIPTADAFLAKFDPSGSKLEYATYLGTSNPDASTANVVASGADGSAYFANRFGVYRFDPSGATLLGYSAPLVSATAITVAPDGRVYLAGEAGSGSNQFQTTPAVFQPYGTPRPQLPAQGAAPAAGIMIMDAGLTSTLSATYFGQYGNIGINALALDSSGNLYLAGSAKVGGLPTRTPLQLGFGGSLVTGFAAELSADFSTLLFSSYFGDGEFFYVTGLGVGPTGTIALAGVTDQGTAWVNSVQPAVPFPSLRIDSVVNAASQLAISISAGQTMVVRGGGFGGDAQVFLGGVAVPAISVTPNSITATVPPGVAAGPITAQVQSGGMASNAVLLNVTATSPGLFSTDGSGLGQAYILNEDGRRNSPAHPTAPGRKITVYATGVGSVAFTDGYAVTQFPADVYINGSHCDGLAAVMRPATGLPGSVYQLTVVVPNPAAMASSNPNLLNFKFPSQSGVVLRINGLTSQNGIAISIGQSVDELPPSRKSSDLK